MERKTIVQIFLSILLSLCFSCVAQASANIDIYSVELQVPDKERASRNEQIPGAFAQVVKKVASSQRVLEHPEYITALMHLDRFVSHYYYLQTDDGYKLTLRFNKDMINQLVTKMGRTILPFPRNDVLLWLVITDAEQKTNLIGYDHSDSLTIQMSDLAKSFGMPVVIPLMDLTERVFVREDDIMAQNLDVLLIAAERYNADTILLGNVKNYNDVWYCEWSLVTGKNTLSWDTQGNDLSQQLELMVSSLAEKLVTTKSYQALNIKQNAVSIPVRVNGLASAADYSIVLDHLKSLHAVTKVEIGSVHSNFATFVLNTDEGTEKIIHDLKISKILRLSPTVLADATSSDYLDLSYRKN